MPHPLAMASGIMPEATPPQLIDAAARAGFDYGGMWIEPATWRDATTRTVRARLAETGLALLDVEVVWIKPGAPDPDHARIVEIGAELGARNVLCVSSDPDRAATIDKLAALVDLGGRLGIRVNLEFGLFTEVRTIHDASAILAAIDRPAAGLLIDALHWTRSGGTIADLAAVPTAWLSYCQFCDAPSPGADPADAAAILDEAIDGRIALGHGGLDLVALAAQLPEDLPIAIEQRSKRLRDAFPDLDARAAEVARTGRAWLTRLGYAHKAQSKGPDRRRINRR